MVIFDRDDLDVRGIMIFEAQGLAVSTTPFSHRCRVGCSRLERTTGAFPEVRLWSSKKADVTWKKYRKIGVQVAALALSLGLALAPIHAAQDTEAPQAMTGTQPTSDVLSAKQQAIPLIAAFMAMSDMLRLNAALNQGLDAGLTISEAKEILVQLYAYVGFPRSLNALGELMKVVDARKQRGVQDAPGREPSRATPTGEDLVAAGTANQTRISGGPVKGPVFDFAPVINRFLQAHLFGEIFERDSLDWQSRELATVGALAATPGVEAQLQSHMRASMRVGLSAAQLRQGVQVLADRGDEQAARRASVALTQALAAASGS